MEKSYIQDSLVQFLYREMQADEAVAFTQLIEDDFELHACFDALLLAKTQLPKAHFNPSPAVLNNILQYSTKTALEASL